MNASDCASLSVLAFSGAFSESSIFLDLVSAISLIADVYFRLDTSGLAMPMLVCSLFETLVIAWRVEHVRELEFEGG